MMLPYNNNNSMSMSVYSDYVEKPEDIANMKYHLNVNINQTVKLENGMSLHDLIVQFHDELIGLDKEGFNSFNFNVNPSWNDSSEYNIYTSFSIVEEKFDDIIKDMDSITECMNEHHIIELVDHIGEPVGHIDPIEPYILAI